MNVRGLQLYVRAAEGAPPARQVKLEVLSNHGDPKVAEIGTLRLYPVFEPVE